MPRLRPPDRLPALLVAASRVFRAKGYRRAQMADVAREMGVSPGTLYNLVEGKEALFLLLLERDLGPAGAEAAPPVLPVPSPDPAALIETLRARIGGEVRLPALDAALARRAPKDVRAELEAIVTEQYDLVARYRRSLALLERSALDWPELAKLFYTEVRLGVLERLARWIERRIREGRLRPVAHVGAAARLVVETIAWFAMHRHGDVDGRALPDAATRTTVVDLLVHAFLPEDRR